MRIVLRDHWDNISHNNTHRGTRGEERGQGIENIFEEIMTEKFPNMVKEIDI